MKNKLEAVDLPNITDYRMLAFAKGHGTNEQQIAVLRLKTKDLKLKKLLVGDRVVIVDPKLAVEKLGDGGIVLKTGGLGDGYVCRHGVFMGEEGVVTELCRDCADNKAGAVALPDMPEHEEAEKGARLLSELMDTLHTQDEAEKDARKTEIKHEEGEGINPKTAILDGDLTIKALRKIARESGHSKILQEKFGTLDKNKKYPPLSVEEVTRLAKTTAGLYGDVVGNGIARHACFLLESVKHKLNRDVCPTCLSIVIITDYILSGKWLIELAQVNQFTPCSQWSEPDEEEGEQTKEKERD